MSNNVLNDLIVGDIGMFGMYWPWDPKENVEERVRNDVGMLELFSWRNVLIYTAILGIYAFGMPYMMKVIK